MDVSRITDYLYIAAYLDAKHAEAIQALNVRLIINMIFIRPAQVYTQPPFRIVTLRTFDSPLLPIPTRKLWKGVEASLPVIQNGSSILVYCREGRHRSVAMSAAILIAMGYNSNEAMKLIKKQREKADPDAKHIRKVIEKFEKEWKKVQSQTIADEIKA